jgi:TonB family protein
MAAVYEAYDARLERAIALKVLPPEFLHDPTFARRFEKEARLVAKLEHPNIVTIYATGVDEGIPWMSMRLLAGGSVDRLLKYGRPGPPQIVRMLRDVANALDYAHACGVVHRDIKPTNLLLDGHGQVCVSDFGLAQMLERGPGLTRTGTLVGTPQYMAPEQALGSAADHRSDIYSLGIVAYEMFTGDVPFTAATPVAVLLKHVNEPLPELPAGLLQPSWMEAIRKATAKNPADRWPSAGAFVAVFEAAADGTLPVAPAAHSARAGTARRSGFGRTGLAGVAMLAAGAVAWLAVQGRPSSLPASPPRSGQPTDMLLPADPAPVFAETNLPAAVGPAVAAPERVRPAAPALSPELPLPPAESTPPLAAPIDTEPLQLPRSEPALANVEAPAAVIEERAGGTPSADTSLPSVLTMPVRTRTVSPDYPRVARAAELQGDVVLRATIGIDGKVSDVEVVQAVHPVLDEAARKAVLQYEYTPGRRNGTAEAVVIRIAVSFRLN